MLKRLLFFCCCCVSTVNVFAQQNTTIPNAGAVIAPDSVAYPKHRDSAYVIIRNIDISGNKKTKAAIILRELDLHPGDTLYFSNAMEILEERRQQIINTSLFLSVSVYFKKWTGKYTDIAVDVIERWYIFPFPIFSLADRNFNVWWVEEQHSLNRINYGVNFYDNNLSGKNDQLIFTFQSGYTHSYGLTYNLPYFDKLLRSGLGFTIFFKQNREVNYETDLNKLAFVKTDRFISKKFYTGINYTYQKNIRTKHLFALQYNYLSVADTVVQLNPNYLLDGLNRQRYFEFDYRFDYTGADNWAYPLHGFNFIATFSQKGFGILGSIHQTQLQFIAAKYWQLFPKTYLAMGLRGQLQLPAKQPYFLQQDIGYYENYLRGLEYYVVNANDYAILKTNLKRELFHFNVNTYILPKKFATVPIAVYAKIYADLGYAHDYYPGNSMLSNKLLYTEGFGIDIVTFYDVRLRIEYSFNQLGQNGLFLHTKSEL
jgi:Surface antigen variable number repeat